MQVDQHLPVPRRDAGLLGQFTLGGQQGRLPVDVQQAGRQFVQAGADRVPVLVDQQHVPVLVQRHDADGAGVFDDLAHRDRAVAHPDLVAPDRDHPATEDRFGLDDLVAERVGHCTTDISGSSSGSISASGWGISTGSRSAALYSSAAPMNDRNIGCARVGRDFSSGCAWVAA